MSLPEQPQPDARTTRTHGKRRSLWRRALVLSRARKRWRWTLRALIAVPLALLAAVIVLTHSPLTRMLILPQVASATGLGVDAASVYIRSDGTVVMERAEFTIPGVAGEAGKFLKIAQVEASVEWWKTIRGEPTIGRVTMTDPVLIVSQSLEDGSLNVGSVPIPAGQSGGMKIPGIVATNVGVELGEHSPGGYTRLKRIQMDGSVTPTPDTPGVFAVTLYEAARRRAVGSATGFRVGGTISEGRIDLNLINFSLSDWPPSTLPKSIREIAEDFDLSGEVPRAQFVYTDAEGITASMQLQGVAMNLPLEASVQGPELIVGDEPPPIRYMRMRAVDGSITFARDSVVAKVGGLIEDLPYQVTLRYDGVDADSPFNLEFNSKDFLISRNPELLLYAPPNVKYYLRAFLMPTGLLTTRVNVERGPPIAATAGRPAQPGEISVSGSVDFREGTAGYESFPYEFNDMTGRFEFDNNELRIVSVTGRSKTGARLHARGSIGPLDETSEVDIHVAVADAQIDEAMEAAFGPDRGKVISALFNDERHQQLVDSGLVRTPEQAEAEAKERAGLELLSGVEGAAAAERLAELKRRELVPVFEFRGRADVVVHVYSPRGAGADYRTSVDVALPRAGLVPEKFPYPMIAEDVAVEVRDKKGRLTFGNFRGLNGGRAEVNAEFNVPGKSDVGPGAPPEIDIRAMGIPVDDLLINALPGGSTDSGFKRVLRDLRVSATASGEVHIGGRPWADDTGEPAMGFDANVRVTSGEARPLAMPGAEGVAIAELSGSFEANERELFLDMEGVPVRVGDDLWMRGAIAGPPTPLLANVGVEGIHDSRIGGTLTVHVRGEFPESDDKDVDRAGDQDNSDASYFVAATCPGVDVGAGVESLINVFSPKGGARVSEIRQEYRPEGAIDVRTEAQLGPGDSTEITVDLSGGRMLSGELLSRRLTMPEAKGNVTLRIGETSEVRFESLAGELLVGASGGEAPVDRAGTVLLEGQFPLGAGAPGLLSVALLDGRFESIMTRAVLEQFGDDEAAEGPDSVMSIFSRLKPSGTFDANLVVKAGPTGADGVSAPMVVHGRLEVRTLAIQPSDRRIEMTRVGGSVEFEPGSGVLRELELESPEWSIRADGAWTMAEEGPEKGSVKFRSSLSARGNTLSDDVRQLLPTEVQTLLTDLKIGITGPFRLSDASLDVDRSNARGTSTQTRFAGTLDFAGAKLEAGVPISEMDGSLLIRFDSAAAGAPPKFELDLRARQFEVSGITLSEGRAKVRSGAAPGSVRISEVHGMCHGGRFHVNADVAREGDGRRVNAEFRLSGVRFSTLLRELVQSIKPLVGPPAPLELLEVPDPRTSARRREEFSRGLLDAELTLTTLSSDLASRRGRGTMRISGGRVLNLPIMTGLIEALNLQLPFNSSLDFAWASMFIEGPVITFDDLSVQSAAIELSGGGTMTWPERELDLRLQSRSVRPIPILSAIWQGIRHQLVVTTITGKLGEQVVGIEAPGPSRMIDGIVGGKGQRPSPGEVGGDRGIPERARDRSGKRGIRPQPASVSPASQGPTTADAQPSGNP